MLVACVSLRNAENFTSCGFDSVRDRYEDVMNMIEAQLSAAREGFAEFASEAAAYAKCCTGQLPAIGHRQCQREFEQLTACIRKTLAGAKK